MSHSQDFPEGRVWGVTNGDWRDSRPGKGPDVGAKWTEPSKALETLRVSSERP